MSAVCDLSDVIVGLVAWFMICCTFGPTTTRSTTRPCIIGKEMKSARF